MDETAKCDILIIGSGLGGSAAAHVLKDTGLDILILERGDFLKQGPENWDIEAVVLKRRYDADETWFDGNGVAFRPRVYYNVGGSTKVYGGSALRFREQDFAARELEGGTTIAWPVSYRDLEPFYDKAESILGVHGLLGEDPTEPCRKAFPLPPLPHEQVIEVLAERLRAQGLHPIHLPLAIDQGPGGRCQKGSPCDGFPCKVRAKGDAENNLLRPILLKKAPNMRLWTNSRVDRLETDPGGTRVVGARVIKEGRPTLVNAEVFIVAAGAVNSAALLLKSGNNHHPDGLANSSGLIGRNFMSHNSTVVMALCPLKANPTVFQKTLAVHDFYQTGSSSRKPLGAIQLRGKVKEEMLRNKNSSLVRLFGKQIARRSIDLWVMTEDLPHPESRVTVDRDGCIHLARVFTNRKAHAELIRKTRQMMRRAGFPLSFVDPRGVSAIQHQCGTARFGTDPRSSVLDPWCKAHDLLNLYVMDSSFFPSSAAVNPSLTILAQALRASERLKEQLRA
jgi:choline dehydrogenase-like flavoprotein